MRIMRFQPFQLISDLHLEKRWNISNISNIKKSGDVLVLAGDIGIVNNKRWYEAMYSYKEMFSHVIYVTGNHEYWDSSIEETDQYLKNLSGRWHNFYYLNNSGVCINDRTYYGSTFWTPIDVNRTDNMDNKRILSFDYQKRNRLYYESYSLLKKIKKCDYIITHFPPVEDVLIKLQTYNRFHTHNHPELLKKCELWACGHLHSYRPHPKLTMNPCPKK